jgi:competence protein ComEC
MDAGRRPPAAAGDARLLIALFTLGVLFVHAQPRLLPLWALAALAVPALLPWRGRALWAAFAAGLLLTHWQAQRALDARWPASRHGEEHVLRGTIVSLPELETREDARSPGTMQRTWRFTFAPEADGFPERIRTSWYRADADLRGGECWTLRLRLRTPHGSLNPGGFDYEAWLLRQHIGALATVREAERCDETAFEPVLRLRQALVDRVRETLGTTRASAMLVALTVGDTSGLRSADWDTYRVTGTTHLIAISGFNLAIVAGMFFFVVRWSWSLWPRLCLWLPAQRAALLGAALAAVGYALLAGFEPPVARALFMLLVLTVAAWFHRLDQSSRALAWAWLVILVTDPFAVFSPGLWLSFGAVAAIFYFAVGRWRRRTDWRLAVQLQLFLSVVLTPLTLYYFHGWAWSAPLVNLLAVPVFTLLTPLLLVAMSVLLAVPVLGVPLLQFSAWLLTGIQAALDAVATTLPQPWIAGSPPWAALALALIGSLLVFAPRGIPLRMLGLLCFVPLLLPPRAPPAGGFEIAVLDVGQGLAVVVRTQHHTLLFDAGPAFAEGFDAGASVVAPYLLRQGIRDVDLLLLSHGDNDHAGGVPAVRRLLNVRRELGTEGHPGCRDGEHWEWDGVRFAMLHPEGTYWSENNGSCVLRIDGPFSVLLPGDIERRAERRLVQDHVGRLRADVVLAPHHGSATSSTRDFVDAVQPRIAVHAAAWRSHFGHPKPVVVERYAERNARQFITGVVGTVRIWRDPDSGELQVEEWRRRAARWWNAASEP